MHQAIRSVSRTGMVLAFAALASAASAQNDSRARTPSTVQQSTAAAAAAPATRRSAPFPAPVGHAQPRVSDVPAESLDNGRRSDPSFKDLDEKLRICKGC